MKQTLKKYLGIFLAAALMLTGSLCTVFASDTSAVSDSDVETYLVQSVEQILSQLNDLTDENIEALKVADNAYYVSIANAWDGSRNEVGNYVEVLSSNVKQDGDSYIVTLKTKFEKHEADVVVNFDSSMAAESMAISVDYPMSYKLSQAGMNTVLGIATVFIMLLLLSFLISLFTHINKIGAKPAAKPVEKKEQNSLKVSEPVVQAEETDEMDDLELVAVITAAIAASENTSADGFVVRSIKRADQNKWRRA